MLYARHGRPVKLLFPMDSSRISPPLRDDQILTGPAAARAYDCDAYTVDRSKPTWIVLPESTKEVAEVVKWCDLHQVPFTARGAGTGLSGGALPALGGVVISTKRLDQIFEIDVPNRRLRAGVGIANKRISDAVKANGLHFAPDPSSQTVSTLGGNIAENAGGPHTLKYGVTVQHILQVQMVTPQGEIITVGSGAPVTPGVDFLGVICGSEGTLGIVTEAWVKLTPIPKFVRTALVSFREVRSATETVATIIKDGILPAALEMMDKGIIHAVSLAFQLNFHSDAKALLLIECDGDAAEKVEQDIEAIKVITDRFGALEWKLASNDAERAKLWTARKKGVGAMGRLAPTIVTHDCVIPRSKLPEMLEEIDQIAEENGLDVANIFHAGDGNLHPLFYFDDRQPGKIEAVVKAGETIIHRCIELGGSVTGEHGIGVEKIDAMSEMFTADDLEAQMKVRQLFGDPTLCNPCKVIPNQKGCNEHRMRWRGSAW